MINQIPQSRLKRMAEKPEKAKSGFWYFWSGPFTSGDGQASLGKCISWVILVAYLYWIKKGGIDKATLVEALKMVLLYAFAGKAIFATSDVLKAIRGGKPNVATEGGDE